jgi:hypothetical protein
MLWALGALAVLVALLLGAAMDRSRTFRDRFPPLTDAEFLALCPPGTNPEVALKVRAMFAEYFAVDYERVHPSMTFVEDLGAD